MGESLRVYWYVMRTSILERLMYRGDFAFATLLRFLPIVTQILLWGAIFGGQPGRLNGYTYGDMVAYYLLAMVGRAFSSMPGLSSSIARDIRDGTIKKFLTQPIDMVNYLLCGRIAHKLVYYLVAVGPFALVFFLCRGFFGPRPDAATVVGFACSLILAFLLGFLLEALVGLIGFWFLEISSLIFVYMMLSYLLSGHMLPLDWFPPPLSTWVRYLPFQYLAHFPAAIWLGKYPPQALWTHLAVGVGWTIGLWWLTRRVFTAGVKRYGAYGG